MRGRWAILAGWLVVLSGCSVIESVAGEVPEERMPGPAYYLLTVEPDVALDTRSIVLTTNGDHHVDVGEVLRDGRIGGTDIRVIDGRRRVHTITVPWPPSLLHAERHLVEFDR